MASEDADQQREHFRSALVAALPSLKNFARIYCRNPSDAEDLVQLTVERGLTKWRQWSGDGELGPWLFRILRNASVDQGRKTSKMPTSELQPEHWVTGPAAVEDHVLLNEVNHLVMEMPLPQREVLLLVCVEGYSYKEAAELLDIPIGTVMSRLSRGRSEIARRMEASADERAS